MYYSIHQIQPKIANIASFKEKKVEIIKFFNIENIVNNLGIDTIYTSDNHPPFFIKDTELKKIYDMAEKRFGIEFKISDFYEGSKALLQLDENNSFNMHKVYNNKDIESILELHFEKSSYGKREQIKDFERQEQKDKRMEVLQVQIDARKEKEREDFDLASNLLRDFQNEKVVSIDFEFFIRKDGSYDVTEMGISFNENGKNNSFHFLIEEHYLKKKNKDLQKRFDFGVTEIIKEKQIPKLIEMALLNCSYVLFHEQREDYEILNQMKINIPKEIIIIDTQLSYKRYFRKKGSLPNGEKLEELLNMFKMPYKNLHNAGNDAYMTLVLLHKMSAIQQHLHEATKEKKFKIR